MSDSSNSSSTPADDTNPPIVWDADLVFMLHTHQVATAMICLGYGCFFILAIVASRVLLRRGLFSFAQRTLLATVVTFAVCTTINFICEYSFLAASLAAGPYDTDPSAHTLAERVYPVNIVFTRLIYLLNDALVIWRAWVLADYKLLRLSLAVSFLITVGCAFTEGALQIQAGIIEYIAPLQHLYLFVPLLWNNFFATSIVLFKTWRYRREIKKDLQQAGPKSQVESVLFLLVESGFIYCTFWILWIIAQYVKTAPPMFREVINDSSPFISAIYPLLIILVVEHQKSRSEQIGSDGTFSQSLNFAPSPRQRTKFSGTTQTVSIIQSIVDRRTSKRMSTIATDSEKAEDSPVHDRHSHSESPYPL